jgi:hypothetical protein
MLSTCPSFLLYFPSHQTWLETKNKVAPSPLGLPTKSLSLELILTCRRALLGAPPPEPSPATPLFSSFYPRQWWPMRTGHSPGPLSRAYKRALRARHNTRTISLSLLDILSNSLSSSAEFVGFVLATKCRHGRRSAPATPAVFWAPVWRRWARTPSDASWTSSPLSLPFQWAYSTTATLSAPLSVLSLSIRRRRLPVIGSDSNRMAGRAAYPFAG